MSYKVTISGNTGLEKCLQFVLFNTEMSDSFNKIHTSIKNTVQITGKIGTEENTVILYKWALLPASDPECYKSIVVEQYQSNQLVRKVCFSKAFVVDYSESYSNSEGFGTFSIRLRQFIGKKVECESAIVNKANIIKSIEENKEPLPVPVVHKSTKPLEIKKISRIENNQKSFTDRLISNTKEMNEDNKTAYLPKNNGKWLGEEGNSKWVPDPEFVPKNPKTNPQKLSWKEISEKYCVSDITFKNNEPDFSPISKGTVEIDDFSSDRDDNFDSADETLAKDKGYTKADVRRWRKKNKYTWHERKDCKTMDKVPTCVHGNITHSGGISESKKGEN